LTHFADLTHCDYFGTEYSHTLLAVGWLAQGKSFPIGSTEPAAYSKLKELLNDPWQPMVSCGVHDCELCQFDPPSGHVNLFVPNGAAIFVCPSLIIHYIAAHHYQPPSEFLAAVIACPDTRSIEYKKMFLQSGGRALVAKTG
jgi:hypothetical protein